MIDPETLPYTVNPRSLEYPSRYVLVAATVIMGGIKLAGYANSLSWGFVFAPVLTLAAMMLAYNLIRNAVHEGVRLADADDYLDRQVITSMERDRIMKLTPERLSAAMGEMG